MSSLTFEPIFDSLPLVLLVALVGLGLLFAVRPSGPGVGSGRLTSTRMRALFVVRMLVLVVLLLALLRPTLVRTDSRPTAATFAVLVDDSRSMTLSDGAGQSRWDTERQLLRRLVPALQSFDDQLDLKIFAYGEQTEEIPPESLDMALEKTPDRAATDLAIALRTALASASGRPLAGVVMLGDGTSTVADSNPAAVARTLGSLEVPLWTLPIGPPAGDGQNRDAAVEQLPESYQVFSQNLFRVEATIQARALAGRDLPVNVTLVNRENQRERLATRIVVPSGANDTLPIQIELVAPAPGNYRLEVEVEPQPGESLTDNNRQLAFLDVKEGGGRIFYVEGRPRVEQLFLRRTLDESTDLEMTLQIAPEQPTGWPTDIGQATNPGQYDVFIIGDVDADALGDKNLNAIASAIERGAGLLMLGGERAFDLGGYATSPLAKVLPVELDRSRRISGDRQPPPGSMLEESLILRVRRPHPITAFGTPTETKKVWEELKPLLGANRFQGVKASPTVEVLLESTAEQPILVVGEYGSGRTAVFAGDTTWRWWRQGRDEVHRRFWRQIILWLLARDAPDFDAVWVRPESRRFESENPIRFTAGVRSLTTEPIEYQLTAELVSESGERFPITVIREPEAEIANRDTPLVSGVLPKVPGGLYMLRVEAKGGEQPPKPAEMLVQAVDLDRELSRPLAEISRLEQLSALTANVGGRSYRPDEIDDLIDAISQMRSQAELPVVEKNRLGDGPISGWILMLCFAALMSSEWMMRKAWGLA